MSSGRAATFAVRLRIASQTRSVVVVILPRVVSYCWRRCDVRAPLDEVALKWIVSSNKSSFSASGIASLPSRVNHPSPCALRVSAKWSLLGI